MITKAGEELRKMALMDVGIGAMMGGVRAATLSEAQKDALRRKYLLDHDANLVARNIGRGIAGSVLGSTPGALMTVSGLASGDMGQWLSGTGIALAGAGLGGYLASNKYSTRGAKRALREEDMKRREMVNALRSIRLQQNAQAAGAHL